MSREFRKIPYAQRRGEFTAKPTGLAAGHYKMRSNNVWLPVLVAVENSRDDDGNETDRPRLVLYADGERHERPDAAHWSHRIWPISEDEWRRLTDAHENVRLAPWFNLNTAGSLF
jgi:hypothetical protein